MWVWEVYEVYYGYDRVVYTSLEENPMGQLTSIKQGEVVVALSSENDGGQGVSNCFDLFVAPEPSLWSHDLPQVTYFKIY